MSRSILSWILVLGIMVTSLLVMPSDAFAHEGHDAVERMPAGGPGAGVSPGDLQQGAVSAEPGARGGSCASCSVQDRRRSALPPLAAVGAVVALAWARRRL